MNNLLKGAILGLSAGITPGPLLTLVVAETLKHDVKEGIKVASTPVLTDLPIILMTVFLLLELNDFDLLLGILSFLGGCYVVYLGYENLTLKGFEIEMKDVEPQSIKKGIITNILSPHHYIFWATVGTPIILEGLETSLWTGISFVIVFFSSLVGTKIGVSVLVAKYKNVLKNKWYLYLIKFLGLILIFFALLLFKEALYKF